jgi:hypothetical protein
MHAQAVALSSSLRTQGVYWTIEGAAFVLMKLASRGSGAQQWRRRPLHAVKDTMPAHHSDPRYAWGLCRAVLDRVAAGSDGDGAPADLAPTLQSHNSTIIIRYCNIDDDATIRISLQ